MSGARPVARRRRLQALGATVCATLTLLPLAACQGPAPEAAGPRVVILGFDGMDWELTQQLIAEGRMPHFARLAADGLGQPLATSIPPLSPVAWSDFITGLDSTGHGIFDFVHREFQEADGRPQLIPYESTSRSVGAARSLKLGSWQFPLGGGSVELLRRGTPFWQPLHDHDVPTALLRIPANYPPAGVADAELSGMGTPDLLGTAGTFAYYDSDPFFEERQVGGGSFYPLDYWDGVATGKLHGPDHPFRTERQPLTLDFELFVDPDEPIALLRVGDEERILRVGDWSDWVPIRFPMIPTQSLAGQVRFHLRSVRPEVQLYASPINLDPYEPAQPISVPADYAATLAETSGRFYTQGFPEDTKSLTEGALTMDEFLDQAALAHQEFVDQLWPTLERHSSGLLFYYFGNIDQVSHILWGSMDPEHPAYDPEVDPRVAHVVPDLYAEADALVGRVLERLDGDDLLIVMSDHGFASWRRSFNLNTWLQQEGYLVLAGDPPPGRPPGVLSNIDWRRTRAYGMGINGLYLNVAGREPAGMVPEENRRRLLEEIREKLEAYADPETGQTVVRRLFLTDEVFDGGDQRGIGPDAVVGYAETYRGSNASGLGEVTAEIVSDNTDRWTGDHAMDPDVVRGILFASRPLRRPAASLQDLGASVLAELGIDNPGQED